MDLLLIANKNSLHCVYIKEFNRLCATRHNIGIKSTFVDIACSALVMKGYWKNIKMSV